MTDSDGLTLQISLAPSDARIARHLLPHQLSTFAPFVDRVMLTVDGAVGGGKFADGSGNESALGQILDDAATRFPNVEVRPVRYDAESIERVSAAFFGGTDFGLKDRRGGPCHSYLDAILAGSTRYLLHTDSDMMFGGQAGPWLDEAIRMLDDPQIVTINPLGGPPGDSDSYQRHKSPTPVDEGHLFDDISTRLFLIDVEDFLESLCPLPAPKPFPLSQRLERWLGGHPDQELPEILFSRSMLRHELKRLDMLGSGAGLWAVHPVHKTEQFIAMLPSLIDSVEQGEVPPEQRGHYDIQPAFAELTDLPGLSTKVRRWLTRSPRQTSTSAS